MILKILHKLGGYFCITRLLSDSRTLRSSSSAKGEHESQSIPTTPVLGPAKDGVELRRTPSGRSIPALAQTSTITVEAERALSSSPKSASLSLGEAAGNASPEDINKSSAATEDLPTPPDTPGPSTDAATTEENTAEPEEHRDSDISAEATNPEPAPQDSAAVEPDLPDVKKISYHEDADINVKVLEPSGEEAVYAVCSSVLQTASRILKQTVPAEAASPIDLTSEPAFGLNVLFSIAHYKFQDVPQTLDAGELYDVAFVAEKYQTTTLLAPFVKSWLATNDFPAAAAAADSLPSTADKVLVAGWVLGQAQWLAQLVSQCACNASLGADGTLLDASGRPWSAQPVSSSLLDLVAAARQDAVARIVQVVSDPVSKLLSPQSYPGEQVRYCHAADATDEAVREECEQLQLGSAIMGLTKAGLWPPPEASRIKASPVALARSYAGVKMRRYLTPGLRFQDEEKAVEDAHAQCGFGHQAEIAKILSRPAELSAGLAQELEGRARLSGAYTKSASDGVSEASLDEVTPSAEATNPTGGDVAEQV